MKTKTSVLMALVTAIVIFGFSSITLADYSGASLARNWTEICNGGVTEVTFTGSVFKLQPILAGIPIPAGNVRCYAAYVQGDTLYIAQRINGMLVFMPYNPQDTYIPYYDISYFDGNSWTPTAFDSYMPNGTSVSGKSFFFGIAPLDVNTIAEFAQRFYGDWINFKAPTDSNVTDIYDYDTVPVVIIDDSDNYGIIPTTSSTATIVGYIVSDGGRTLSARGVCYGRTENPTLTSGTCVASTTNSSLDVFQTTLSGLSSNTLYHARAYATNSIGTNYSQDVKFATQVAAPGTSTTAFRATINTVVVAQNVAYVNYTITADGSDLPVLSRGVCFGTAANPATICTPDATGGTGTFTAVNTAAVNNGVVPPVTGFPLAAGNTYHARVYAVNSNGIVYSSDYSFNVAGTAGPPVVATPTVQRNGTVATVVSHIITDGGSPITARGVCYATTTNANPLNTANVTSVVTGTPVAGITCTSDIAVSNTLAGGGGLDFYSTLQPLTAGSLYQAVTYVINQANPTVPTISAGAINSSNSNTW